MATALVVVALVGLIAGRVLYGNWLLKGIKPREFETRVPRAQLRDVFSEKVARTGWKIVDDGNPMIAQSSLATGIRQQISLELRDEGATTVVRVGPQRWVTKWGVPKKGHTIRMRLDSYVNAVRDFDPNITPQAKELHGR